MAKQKQRFISIVRGPNGNIYHILGEVSKGSKKRKDN